MKNSIAIIILLFLFTGSTKKNEFSYIKDYYQQMYQAQEAFYLKNYQQAYDIMHQLEKQCKLLNQPTYNELETYAFSAAYLGKQSKALKLATLLIKKHGLKIDDFNHMEAFKEIIKTKRWKKIKKKYNKLRSEYLNTIDYKLRKEIKEMTELDQKYRTMMNDSKQYNDSLWKLQSPIDSTNNIKFQHIMNTIGYPDYRIIGVNNVDSNFIYPGILLFHINDYDYYSKTLLKLIDEGKAPPRSLGNFVDSYQRRIKNKKRFIYGIYSNVGEENIIDYPNLDKRRISIGMPPIELENKIRDMRRAYFFPEE